MKASELRIGNLLQKSNGKIFTVSRLDNTNDVQVLEERGLLTLGYNLLGIPLTEEWLLKFGFEVKIKTSYSTGLPVDFNIYEKGSFKFNEIQGNWWLYGVLVKKQPLYVHKLQNLFYEIEGEELTIKDDVGN